MNARSDSPAPGTIRLERVLALFPEVPELRLLMDSLIPASQPDPTRRWSGSGELGSVGERIVNPRSARRRLDEHAREEGARLSALMGRVGIILQRVSEGKTEEAVAEFLAQGAAEEEASRLAEAERWYLAGHRLARESGSPRAPEGLRKAARAARGRGRLAEAEEWYERAARDAADLGREEDEVVARIGRGNVAVDRGRWSEAEGWYREALALLPPRIGDAMPAPERWQLHQNLGITARKQGHFEEARVHLEVAREMVEALGDPEGKVDVENGYGMLRLAEGNPKAAALHFRNALAGARSPLAQVVVGVNLGEALLAAGRALDAGEVARNAEARALAAGVVGKLPEVYRLLAKVAEARGEGDAFVLLERALTLVRNHGLPPYEEALTLEAYGKLRTRSGEEQVGREALERAMEIYRTLESATTVGLQEEQREKEQGFHE